MNTSSSARRKLTLRSSSITASAIRAVGTVSLKEAQAKEPLDTKAPLEAYARGDSPAGDRVSWMFLRPVAPEVHEPVL